jgi:hypothetical protein
MFDIISLRFWLRRMTVFFNSAIQCRVAAPTPSLLPEALNWTFILPRFRLASRSCHDCLLSVQCFNKSSLRGTAWSVTDYWILLLSGSWISRVVATKNSMATRHPWHLSSQLLIVALAVFYFYREHLKYLTHLDPECFPVLCCGLQLVFVFYRLAQRLKVFHIWFFAPFSQ